MNKTITNCPKCGSKCLDYRSNGSILCTVCMTAIVKAPDVDYSVAKDAGDVLLMFYRALGWNGVDTVDPCKVRTTNAVYMRIYDAMLEQCPDVPTVGVVMINKAPGVDDGIPSDKVYLLKGWTVPGLDGGKG